MMVARCLSSHPPRRKQMISPSTEHIPAISPVSPASIWARFDLPPEVTAGPMLTFVHEIDVDDELRNNAVRSYCWKELSRC
jgi:hypothetical protein